MSDEPYDVRRVGRQIIEKRVMDSLAQGDKIAALLTKEDCEDLRHVIEFAINNDAELPKWREQRLTDFRQGLEILLTQAFSHTDKAPPRSSGG